jgi:hypothetical protein
MVAPAARTDGDGNIRTNIRGNGGRCCAAPYMILDLRECERVVDALFPPPKPDPVAEAVERAVGAASSG